MNFLLFLILLLLSPLVLTSPVKIAEQLLESTSGTASTEGSSFSCNVDRFRFQEILTDELYRFLSGEATDILHFFYRDCLKVVQMVDNMSRLVQPPHRLWKEFEVPLLVDVLEHKLGTKFSRDQLERYVESAHYTATNVLPISYNNDWRMDLNVALIISNGENGDDVTAEEFLKEVRKAFVEIFSHDPNDVPFIFKCTLSPLTYLYHLDIFITGIFEPWIQGIGWYKQSLNAMLSPRVLNVYKILQYIISANTKVNSPNYVTTLAKVLRIDEPEMRRIVKKARKALVASNLPKST